MRILIFVSNQSNSKSAVMFGGLIARHTNSSVTLLTVIDESQDLRAAHQSIDTAGWWIPDLDVCTSIRIGAEVNCILEEINIGPYDLIILKARQAIQIKDFLTTKIGRRVARQSPISVLIVKKKQPELNRILICTSGVDIADPVIEMGAQLARSTQANVTLLHVASSVPSMYTGLDKLEEPLSDLLQTDTPVAQHLRAATNVLAEEKVDAKLKLRHGAIPDEILIEAQTAAYDLIVIGASRASSNLTGWLMGDVAQKIVNQVQCPVLVVRQEKSSLKRIDTNNEQTKPQQTNT